MTRQYANFEDCWIELWGKPGLHPGKVVARFELDTDYSPFYIIKIADSTHPTLEIRDALLMSPTAGERPPMALTEVDVAVDRHPLNTTRLH